MKILVISNLYPPDFLGGYELACHQAVVGLRAAGHEVYVLTAAPRNGPVPLDPAVDRRLRLADVYDSYAELKSPPAMRAVLLLDAYGVQAANVHALGEVIEGFRPDVAYVWNVVGLGGLGILAALQHLGIPWVMHLGDNVPMSLCAFGYGGLSAPDALGLTNVFNRLCRGRFICCSQTLVNEIEASGLRLADRTTLIPNWVVTDGCPNRVAYRTSGPVRIALAGSLCVHKGVDILIRAAALLRDRGLTDFEIDIYAIGNDPQFAHLVRILGVDDHVRICAQLPQRELVALYSGYDIFAFPTRSREPFGTAPLEALAYGCVPLVSRCCGFAEWFVDGVDCLKADRTPEAFADVLEAVIGGRIPLAEIGQRGAKIVSRDFHLGAILPRIEAELRAAIAAGGGPARPMAEVYRMAMIAHKTLCALLCETAA